MQADIRHMDDHHQTPRSYKLRMDNVSLGSLPPYARSLLRIPLPVAVRLAGKKEAIREILQYGPGAIIKFDRPCDAMLQLSVGNVAVAEGDAVTVGDKLGLRINRILPPHERFHCAAGDRKKGSDGRPPQSAGKPYPPDASING